MNNDDDIIFEYAAEGNLQGLKQKLLLLTKQTTKTTDDDDNNNNNNNNKNASSDDNSNEDNSNEDNNDPSSSTSSSKSSSKSSSTSFTKFRSQQSIIILKNRNYLYKLRDKKGSTLLHYAAGNGHVDVCRFLLQQIMMVVDADGDADGDADVDADANDDDNDNDDNEDDDDKNKNKNKYNNYNNNNVNYVNYVNIKNSNQQRTALHWSCRNGYLNVCQLLILEYNAKVDILAKGNVTPLQLAIWQCHINVSKYLVLHCNANKYYINNWGCSVYHWLGKSTIGINDNDNDNDNDNGNDVNVNINVNVNADSKTENQNRLWAMCEWLDKDKDNDEYDKTTNLCLWTTPNKYGQTPLHKAGYGGNIAVIKYILEMKGLSDTNRDSQGNTAADCAERNKMWKAAKYLRRYGRPFCLQNTYLILFPSMATTTTTTTTTTTQNPHRSTLSEKKNDDELSTSTTMTSSQLLLLLLLLPIMTPSKPPKSLSKIRIAYKALVKKYHPDQRKRRRKRKRREGDSSDDDDYDDDEITNKYWNSLQEAYTLWTLWWINPNEADVMIRNLERHAYLKRELPLLILYHKTWHTDNTSHTDPDNNNNNNHLFIETPIPSSCDRVEVVDDGDDDSDSSKNQKKKKRQKISRGGHDYDRSSFFMTPEKRNELDEFERRLVRLLLTLPKQQIALSQLPKEYEKTYYDGQQHNNNNMNSNSESIHSNAGGINIDKKMIMINPKDYRCRKLGYLLEKYCSRTVEVIKIISPSSTTTATTKNNTKNAGSFTYWVKLKDTIQ